MTATRRKSYIDLAAVKRSRKNYVGGITRAKETLQTMLDLDPSELNTRKIEGALTSITRAETGFYSNLDEAQAFIAEDEAQEEKQAEEDEATELFEASVQEARELGDALLLLTNLRKNLDDFKIDLDALQTIVQDHPDQPHHTAVEKLEATHLSIRQDWKRTDLDQEHSIKQEIDTSKRLLTKLASEVAAQRETRDSASSHSSHSSSDSTHTPRELESKFPTIDVPTFHGDIMKWSSFWSSFKATIDSKRLSKTNKLTYLRKAIKDVDYQTLLHSPQETPDFYDEVVEALKSRFNRTKEIHRNLVHSLVTLPPVKNTRSELRKRVDDFKHLLSSLKHTGHFDLPAVLSSLLYHTLPVKLQTLWDQQTKKTKGVSPITELLAFLADHAETLPATQAPASTNSSPAPHQQKKSFYKGERKPKTGMHAVTPVAAPLNTPIPTSHSGYRWECFYCKPEKHPLFLCSKWLGFSVSQRISQATSRKLCKNCLANGHSTENCRSTYRCRECNNNHHSTLHQDAAPSTAPSSTPSSAGSSSVPVNSAMAVVQKSILMTAQVLLTGPRCQSIQTRAFIDPGAAMSLVSSRITQQLHLPLEKTNLQFSAVLDTPCKTVKHITNLSISSLQGEKHVSIRAAVVNTVTGDIPAQETETVSHLPHLADLDLADPTFHLPGKVDILLGSEVYPQLMTQVPMVTGAPSEPAALQTIFGWAIIGPVKSASNSCQQMSILSETPTVSNEDLNTLFSNFWFSQDPERPTLNCTQVEVQIEDHYLKTVSYSPENRRYRASLPWKPDAPALGDSRSQALSRFISNERSILRRGIWKEFQAVVQSYLDLGHAEPVPSAELGNTSKFYLPMHSVVKQSSTSTKLRVVFDGSALTTSGHSLNQSLLVGPTLHPSLVNVILKFRTYPIAMSADVSKMYREVELSVPDREFHRFLWRSTPEGVIQEYRMTRVTFGVSASPYLAVRTLQQCADDHSQGQPETAQHIKSSFYVDDLLAGASSVEAALELFSSLREVLLKGGFHLCKWRSSSPSVMKSIPSDLHETLLVKEMAESESILQPKALGLEWDAASDCMRPAIPLPIPHSTTKRGIIASVSRTFDALGWISPTILPMKLIFQQMWELGLDWDDEVPEKMSASHQAWKEQLNVLTQRTLPRCYYRVDATPVTIQLHCFCDALQKACGAVIYVRSTYENHPPLVSLVTSKTKTAKLPKKGRPATTIPRQELCGALLLTEVLLPVKAALNLSQEHIFCWTDSSIVLSWLDSQPKDYKPFVSNRIAAILKVTPASSWRHAKA